MSDIAEVFEDVARRAAAVDPDGEHKVKPLELFFDLVFVFAITQVTSLMFHNSTWPGIGHGMLALAMLWWAWVAYSWLTNEIDPEEGAVRLAMFAAMAAMLVASLATPRAFGADGLVFALAYITVRVLHLVLYATVPGDGDVRAAVLRIAPTSLFAGALLVIAGALGGAARDPLWVAALLIDLGGVYRAGVGGWRVSAGHFAERHGLIVLIALGESIVAVGAVRGVALGARAVAVAVLGIALAGALWWIYFDVVALVAERKLRSLTGMPATSWPGTPTPTCIYRSWRASFWPRSA